MLKASERKTLGVRILLGVVVGMLGVGMLLYLIPGYGTSDASRADVVATVAGDSITVTDLNSDLTRRSQSAVIPAALRPLYVQQALRDLIFEKELAYEAKQLGVQVSDQERFERIRLMIPGAFVGGNFVGNDQYAQQVAERTANQMNVAQFEDYIGESLLQEKFIQLVTDGVNVTPAQIEQEFRRRNDKIKINYVVIKPEELEAKINPSDADLTPYFEKNRQRYSVPERRVVDYALLDADQLRSRVNVSDDEVRAYYNSHLDRYKLEDRAHVAHILFKTVGKTDAETEEIRKKAEDVLKKAKSGGNFGDLAKQYSEDTTKDKGGDLDWIVRGQTVPEFEKVAFSLPKGSVSDLVKTPYGFHIIKVIERENARTKTLDEVRPQIVAALQQGKAEEQVDAVSRQIADTVRRSGRVSLADLAKQFNLTTGESMPLEAKEPFLAVGASPEVSDTIFRLRVGDQSPPIRTDRGYVIFSLKSIQPAHAPTLAEVRDKVLLDYRRDKAGELAKTRAEELGKRAGAGEDLDKLAKSMGLKVETSNAISRGDSIQDIGPATQIQQAFKLKEGQAGPPISVGANWVVYRVVQHQQPDMKDLAKQKDAISRDLNAQGRELAYEAFRNALDARLRQEGKVQINADSVKRLSNSGTPS